MHKIVQENKPSMRICSSAELAERGKGVRFDVMVGDEMAVAFVVRYDNKVHAYLNRCAHIPQELDWNEGDFFESSGLYIMCATHGAVYNPDDGKCVGGPCRGASLRKLVVEERDDQVFWSPDNKIKAVTT
ncbi:MAG: Rieske (2Fe-2S) protein [Glaciimonas sp.]|nr:Rieske (2Fe-2S) protein [Glaciimonas sp.]